MDINGVRQLISKLQTFKDLCLCLQQGSSSTPIRLEGLAGSFAAFIEAETFSTIPCFHLVIHPDKESAAYHFNDLENLLGKDQVLFFPASYRKPYDPDETQNANILYRSEVLNKLAGGRKKIVLVSYPDALFENVVTRSHLRENTFSINKGEPLSVDFLIEFLNDYEFNRVDFVVQPGEFAIRGGILDIFSFSNDDPFRIELYDEKVESIRSFDIETQLSKTMFGQIKIVPDVQQKLLREEHESFFDFIPTESVLWINEHELCVSKVEKQFELQIDAYRKLNHSMFNYLRPEKRFLNADAFAEGLQKFRCVHYGYTNLSGLQKLSFQSEPQPNFNKNFSLLISNLRENNRKGYKNILFADSPKQAERIYSILEDTKVNQGERFNSEETATVFFSLHEGFVDHQLKIACYTDHQIFNRYHKYKLREGSFTKSESISLKELQSLQPGDYVTHIDHGVGTFAGLEKLEVNGKLQEAVRLVYRDNDILYVSIHSLHKIAKYSGQEGVLPKLNKLGSNTWNSLKEKTKKKVKEIAFDLIKLYAARKHAKGFNFSPDSYLQTELEASFIYEDTPDQEKATAAVKQDMEAEAPMDRLICGDVGFGKTEIAIRAAFKAACDGKQVAVLVPTTILALQHYKTFGERLKEFPCTIDFINRFKSQKEQKETIKKLAEGKIDIIIGTHRLIGKDIQYKDLGLLIVDEEQKFGVSAKEKIKTMRTSVDTLTLTATPIPRTLQFSMMGARDLSVIATPPPNRFPVQTELIVHNEEVIRDAVAYELSRGGQVFFVHNRVQNIHEIAGLIQRLVPDARVLIAHGQMDGDKLESGLMDFIAGDYDVLVATTIIESGLDIPNANTIIINQAHMFGLSDLHQMRGRVGRSNKKAFCYLLTPPLSTLTQEARKRLKALEEFSGLGSGFNIALKDLDIRGAGNLLGAEQSGFISEIGFEMYMKILNEAVSELQENEFSELFRDQQKSSSRKILKGMQGMGLSGDCQVDSDLELLLPGDYVPTSAERLTLYRELDELDTSVDLERFKSQLIDRFGPLPVQATDLLKIIQLRWKAIELGLEKIVLKNKKLIAYFKAKPDDLFYEQEIFASWIDFIKQKPDKCKMNHIPGKKLSVTFDKIISVDNALAVFNSILQPTEGSPA